MNNQQKRLASNKMPESAKCLSDKNDTIVTVNIPKLNSSQLKRNEHTLVLLHIINYSYIFVVTINSQN